MNIFDLQINLDIKPTNSLILQMENRGSVKLRDLAPSHESKIWWR